MRYLITGGAGFIGSHLADELLRRDHEVFVVDDLSTGSIDNIKHLKTHDGFSYVIDTCANVPVMAELVDSCDRIFHLAAAVGVKLIVESPVRTIETNVHLTEVMLTLANKKKRPILVASTSEVYGKSEQFPFREDGDLVLGATNKGRWSYACSKAIDEFLAIAYWKERKLPDGGGPSVQHRRPPPDRAIRNGDPELRPSGAGRRPHHRVRRRQAVPLFHPRGRRGPRADRPARQRALLRPGVQHREHRRDHDWQTSPSR